MYDMKGGRYAGCVLSHFPLSVFLEPDWGIGLKDRLGEDCVNGQVKPLASPSSP